MIRRIVLKNYMSHVDTVIEPVFEYPVYPAAVAAPQDRAVAAPQDRAVAAPQDRAVAAPQDRAVAAPQDRPAHLPHGDCSQGAPPLQQPSNSGGASEPLEMRPGGLTVLIGQNNCGKSAIVSAIQTVCQNASGDYMVRHGAKCCSITIETLDGDELVWRREKNKTGYIVNGREVDRLKGSIPVDLHDYLKMPLVKTSRDEVDVHLGEQKTPIFLLADKSADRAAFFAASSDSHRLIQMQSLHRQKVTIAKREFRKVTDRCEQLQLLAGKYQPLEPLGERLDRLESQYAEISRNELRQNRLRELLERLRATGRQTEFAQQKAAALQGLSLPPEQTKTNQLRKLVESLQTAGQRKMRVKQLQQVLSDLQTPPASSDHSRLKRLLNQIRKWESVARSASIGCAVFQQLKEPPVEAGQNSRAEEQAARRWDPSTGIC